MNQLAAQLKQLVEGTREKTKMSPERLDQIQQLTKQSMRTKPFSVDIGVDWTLSPRKPSPLLSDVRTKLSWRRKHGKTYTIEQENLEDITKILDEEQLGDEGPVRILVEAPGGKGKSTAMKHLALSWADGTVESLKKFQFVFHISLKHVKGDNAIENIIISQHIGLKASKMDPAEIKSILEEDYGKVLLLIDGHNEYKTGCNTDIDEIIKNEQLRNCWMILTSRKTEELIEIKEYMDAETEIEGFDETTVRKYIMQKLGNEIRTDELLKQATSKGLCTSNKEGEYFFGSSLLRIPLLLNMICILFVSKLPLPQTRTGIVQGIVHRCISREAIKVKGQKAVDFAKKTLFNLGKLAWQGLSEPGKKQIFEKEEVIKIAGQEALELGLLVGTEKLTLQEEETEVLCFPHLQLQEFAAAFYISHLPKVGLEIFFPTWESVDQHREVVKFALGQSDDPDALIKLIYERLYSFSRVNYFSNLYEEMLKSLGKELKGGAAMDMLHSKYLNFITQEDPVIRVPSRLYVFKTFNHQLPNSADIRYRLDESDTADYSPAECVVDSLDANIFKMFQQIHEYQEMYISKFHVAGLVLNVESAEESIKNTYKLSRNIGSFSLANAYLSNAVLEHMALSLDGCRQLQNLSLYNVRESIPEQLGKSIASMESLKYVDIQCCKMTPAAWHAIMEGLSHCHHLETVTLHYIELTGSVSSMYGSIDHPGFLFLETLIMTSAKLNRDDLEAIAKAVDGNKLPRLMELYLTKNTLTDQVKVLTSLDGQKSILYPLLEELRLNQVKLRHSDIKSISRSVCENKLPKLKILDLGSNTLTGHIEDLFKDEVHPAFSSLEELNLPCTQLSGADLKYLFQAMSDSNMSNCRTLDLSGTLLTGMIRELFADRGLPFVNTLSMNYTSLEPADLESLADAVKCAKLPVLRKLSLQENSLCDAEEHVKLLFKTCVSCFTRNRVEICVSLNDASNQDEFRDQVDAICKGSMVTFSWSMSPWVTRERKWKALMRIRSRTDPS